MAILCIYFLFLTLFPISAIILRLQFLSSWCHGGHSISLFELHINTTLYTFWIRKCKTAVVDLSLETAVDQVISYYCWLPVVVTLEWFYRVFDRKMEIHLDKLILIHDRLTCCIYAVPNQGCWLVLMGHHFIWHVQVLFMLNLLVYYKGVAEKIFRTKLLFFKLSPQRGLTKYVSRRLSIYSNGTSIYGW